MTGHPLDTGASESPLDAEALATFRRTLLSARAVQETAAQEHSATVSELTGQGDVDSLLERELADASALRAQEGLAEIDAALARIDAGTYGSCEACGLAIARERLEVIPQARLCVTCSASRRTPGHVGARGGSQRLDRTR